MNTRIPTRVRAQGKPDGIDEFFPIPPEHFDISAGAEFNCPEGGEAILIAPDGTIWRDVHFNRADIEAAFPMHKA